MNILEIFPPINLLVKGGWVMFVILACSIFALSIIISKYKQLRKFSKKDNLFIKDSIFALKLNGPAAALAVLESSNNPVARVMENCIDLLKEGKLSIEDIEKESIRFGSNELRRLDKGIRELCIIGQITPILGLLGTVIGMIAAFITIQDAGSAVNPALLAGGIWQALLTTAFGLIVAVPTMGSYYWFEGIIDELSSELSDSISEILIISKKDVSLDISEINNNISNQKRSWTSSRTSHANF